MTNEKLIRTILHSHLLTQILRNSLEDSDAPDPEILDIYLDSITKTLEVAVDYLAALDNLTEADIEALGQLIVDKVTATLETTH